MGKVGGKTTYWQGKEGGPKGFSLSVVVSLQGIRTMLFLGKGATGAHPDSRQSVGTGVQGP